MFSLNNKDHFIFDKEIDDLLKSDILEPYPFTVGNNNAFKHPLTKAPDKKDSKKPVKKRSWKKPKGKPKRPLSAYNLFFQHEREQLIKSLSEDDEKNASIQEEDLLDEKKMKLSKRRHRKTHGKIGFAQLARNISQKWKTLDAEALSEFEAKASVEKERYKKEVEEWNKKRLTEKNTETNGKTGLGATELNCDETEAGPADIFSASMFPDACTSDSNQHMVFGAPEHLKGPEHVLSLLEESTAAFRSSNSYDGTSLSDTGLSIPDVQTSSAFAAIDQRELLARLSHLHSRRLATRREHRRMLDTTFALCRSGGLPATQETTAPAEVLVEEREESKNDSIKEEPEQFELFAGALFEDLDPELVLLQAEI